MLFDTHAHYDDRRFDEDREQIIKSVFGNGVSYILNASSDLKSIDNNIKLSKKYDNVYISVGVHPHSASELDDETIQLVENKAKTPKVVAIGEIGLDYYYDHSPKNVQREWFEKQIEIAKKLKLPIIVHDRDAHEDILDIVKKTSAKVVGGVFHCFSGSVEMAKIVLENNFYISIAGPVTFKNAKKVIDVIKYVPIDRILIETDCPYLAPEPHRGQRNNSIFVKLIAEKIAQIKDMPFEEVAFLTTQNGKKLFNIF